ncbi:DUF4215 domain-containing protein [Candidatus Uhrbacteria bacterium]|nr:DUF4215 domain-containing protein [Candidatus Uhrbacteria bacterium]
MIKRLLIRLFPLLLLLMPQVALAQTNFGLTGTFANIAGLGVNDSVPLIVAKLISVLLGFLGVLAVLIVLWGGWVFLTSAGDQKRVKKGRDILRNGLIGLVLILGAYGIASFVISRLSSAISGGTTSSEPARDPVFPPSPGRSFQLNPLNVDCFEFVSNTLLQFSFTRPPEMSRIQLPDSTLVGGLRVIDDATSDDVPGTFSLVGSRVTFTPANTCSGVPCLPADTSYTVKADPSILRSTNGWALVCDVTHPCTYSFAIDPLATIDTAPPSTVHADAPADGTVVFAGGFPIDLQAYTKDDVGVDAVDFSVNGTLFTPSSDLSTSDSFPVAGQPFPTTERLFFDDGSEWDAAGYMTNRQYTIGMKGFDCAANETSTTSRVFLRAANCNNLAIDTDLGETELNCGGSTTSQYYCGACVGGACSVDTDCGTDEVCVAGVCAADTRPRIDQVTPGDGAVGNLISIIGRNFGPTASAGTVVFLGSPVSGDEKTVSAAVCSGSPQWGDRLIVVEVPVGAVDGPIEVLRGDDPTKTDQTDDTYGPHIADFDVNTIVRPGLCSISPSTGPRQSSVTLSGKNFGSTYTASSTVYFDASRATSYNTATWSSTSATATAPLLSSGSHYVRMFIGEDACSINTAELCSATDRCAPADGVCLPLRQGSNPLVFTQDADANPPVINEVVSGWHACAGGANDGAHCSVANAVADCGASISCAEVNDWGPPGQYVTILGSHFGFGGTVTFDKGGGVFALADTDFPPACGAALWNDSTILVKVPTTYVAPPDPIEYLTHNIFVQRSSDAQSSGPAPFTVIDDQPGPALCKLTPVSGPEWTAANRSVVKLDGENLGTTTGTVDFFNGVPAVVAAWDNDEISGAQVPVGATTGAVTATTAGAGYTSNPLPFSVSDCREESADYCHGFGIGYLCCADGSCADVCKQPVAASFVYQFATGPLPVIPRVLEECSIDTRGTLNPSDDKRVVSPSPWDAWGEDACTTSIIRVEFTTKMDLTTFNGAAVAVDTCTDTGDDPCDTVSPVTGTFAVSPPSDPKPKVFLWTPATPFAAGSTYRVTLRGNLFKAIDVPPQLGEKLGSDYIFRFKVRAGTDCDVSGVLVSPADTTLASVAKTQDYDALPMAGRCLVLNPAAYSFAWSSTQSGSVSVVTADTNFDNTATALAETNPDPAHIVALLTGITTPVGGQADITVEFPNPQVEHVWPDCGEACINASAGVRFNTEMNSTQALTTGNYSLWQCPNELCVDGDAARINRNAYLVTPVCLDTSPAASGCREVGINLNSSLIADTFYRVVVSGNITDASGGVALSIDGSNDDQNHGYTNDYSWVFKTSGTGDRCDVASVEVRPEAAQTTSIGDTQLFIGLPKSAPDACSPTGQYLQTNVAWSPWSSADVDVPPADANVDVATVDSTLTIGASLPAGCAGSCLHTGSLIKITDPHCGNGVVEAGEDCDAAFSGGPLPFGCGPTCIHIGIENAACGNGSLDAPEECDDGNVINGDGCSSRCLNEGSAAARTTCGDGHVAYSAAVGGEECDDGNRFNGDGCSSICLHEGTIAMSAAALIGICGNGTQEPGEDCDDNNAVDGDGCSSLCLNEGLRICDATHLTNCCGDPPGAGVAVVDPGEDCDDGNYTSGDGCSMNCLAEGSSSTYTTPSFCGDKATGIGEECEYAGTAVFTPAFTLAKIDLNAAVELDPLTKIATSTITAEANTVKGTAKYSVSCTCTDDTQCIDPDPSLPPVYACAETGCCYPRPTIVSSFPPLSGTPQICRNADIFVNFDQPMAEDLLDENVHLELVGGTCPAGYLTAEAVPNTWYAKAWHHIVSSFRWLFGYSVSAQSSVCYLPITFEVVDWVDTLPDPDAIYEKAQMHIKLSQALEPTAAGQTYQLVINTDDGDPATKIGLLSEHGVGLPKEAGGVHVIPFTTTSELCKVEQVVVQDLGDRAALPAAGNPRLPLHSQVFRKTNEEHRLLSTAFTLNQTQPLQSITGVYAWTYAWTILPSDSSAVFGNDADPDYATNDQYRRYTALGKTGEGTAMASASIFEGTDTTPSKVVNGSVDLFAPLCEQPYYFRDTDSALDDGTTFDPGESDPTYYQFFYCADVGDPASTADDLPRLEYVHVATPVTARGVFKESLYIANQTFVDEMNVSHVVKTDALGVKVLGNPGYLSAMDWYRVQNFQGSPQPIKIDGYDAVRDGNTAYIAAPTLGDDNKLHPNIFVVTTNPNAGDVAVQIFNQAIANWKFNTNVESFNVCVGMGTAAIATDADGKPVGCSWDGDCGDRQYCGADKPKLRRDTVRLTELLKMEDAIRTVAQRNGHCEVRSDIACRFDFECPIGEACLPSIPALSEGTFIRAQSVSRWPSWQAQLGNLVGGTLPIDSINRFSSCDSSGGFNPDPETCFDSTAGKFACAPGSHIYAYQGVGSTAYHLVGMLEYGDYPWSENIDQDTNDYSSLRAEYNVLHGYCNGATCVGGNRGGEDCTVGGNAACVDDPPASVPDGFYPNSFCQGTVVGASAICGDGIQGANEFCEVGQIKPVDCKLGYCKGGTRDGSYCSEATDCATTPGGSCDPATLKCVGGTAAANTTCTVATQATDCPSITCDRSVEKDGHKLVPCAPTAGLCAVTFAPGQLPYQRSCTTTADCESASLYCATLFCGGDPSFGACAVAANCKICSGGIRDGLHCVSDSNCLGSGTCGVSGAACTPMTQNVCAFTTDTGSSATCVAYQCGNGVPDEDEDCDEGFLNGTYGHCPSDCQIATGTQRNICGDGTLDAGESCDCGGLFSTALGGWATAAHCGTLRNGEYGSACAADCRGVGPSCGDGLVQTANNEICDPNDPATRYAKEPVGYCELDPTNYCTGDGVADCPVDTTPCVFPVLSNVCDQGDPVKIGGICSIPQNCDKGVPGDADYVRGSCSAQTYPIQYSLTCSTSGANACKGYDRVGSPNGGGQYCGDGRKTGTEECDDGNRNDNDGCTNSCKTAVCGDNVVNLGVESCDNGSQNGNGCNAPYGGVCTGCTRDCRFETVTGAFCGNNVIEGTELCDGLMAANSAGICSGIITFPSPGVLMGGACTFPGGACSTVGTSCKEIGYCDGGTNVGMRCVRDASVDALLDPSCVGGGGVCVVAKCAGDCASTCPPVFTSQKARMLPEIVNSTLVDSVTLFSQASGQFPNDAKVFLPVCSVLSTLTMDVRIPGAPAPHDTDVVFVLDKTASMSRAFGGSTRLQEAGDAVAAQIDLMRNRWQGSGKILRVGLAVFGDRAAVGQALDADTNLARNKVVNLTGADAAGSALVNAGVSVANGMFSGSADQVMIIVSDSDPVDSPAWNLVNIVKNPDGSLKNPARRVYSLTITNTMDPLVDTAGVERAGVMASVTNDLCAWGNASPTTPTQTQLQHYRTSTDLSSPRVCGPNTGVEYAYTAWTQSVFISAARFIVDSFSPFSVTVTGKDRDGNTVQSVGILTQGVGQIIPIPAGLLGCDGVSSIPINIRADCPTGCTISNVSAAACPAR